MELRGADRSVRAWLRPPVFLVACALVAATVMLTAQTAFGAAGGPSFTTWSSLAGNAGTGGPHSNYQATTTKCSVCHSVHNAPTSPTAELLLRTSAADACTYCHVDTNIGGLQIYGGLNSQYTVDDVYGHNGSNNARCVDCHSVHGAGTFKGAVARKILKRGGAPDNTWGNVQLEAAAAYASLNAGDLYNGTASVQAQVSAFCTECHKVWASASEQTITSSGIWEGSGVVTTYTSQPRKNHPLKSADSNFSAMGSTLIGRAAWLDSTYCRSCHAAGVAEQAGVYSGMILASYPHYTPQRARFLTAGWGAYDTSATAVGAGNAVNDSSQDGVCLRCHTNGSKSGDATAGVGVNY